MVKLDGGFCILVYLFLPFFFFVCVCVCACAFHMIIFNRGAESFSFIEPSPLLFPSNFHLQVIPFIE